jgi:NAD(P)H-dependent FMN reductase
MLNIKIILGSTREGRFGEKPVKWIFDEAKKRGEIDIEIIDLRDYPLPFFNYATSPIMSDGKYENEVASRLAKKISEADGFIIATPEYNHGYPAVLKNAMDFIYNEWRNKPVGFLTWSAASYAYAVGQLHEVAIGLQMIPIKSVIHLSNFVNMIDEEGNLKTEPLQKLVDNFFIELIWLAKVLKTGRESQI